MEEQETALFCNCGCGNVALFQYDPEDETVWVQLVASLYYTEQTSAFRRLQEKWIRIRDILLGKEFSYFELILSKKEQDRLKEYLEQVATETR